jgi:hypothetical protein
MSGDLTSYAHPLPPSLPSRLLENLVTSFLTVATQVTITLEPAPHLFDATSIIYFLSNHSHVTTATTPLRSFCR